MNTGFNGKDLVIFRFKERSYKILIFSMQILYILYIRKVNVSRKNGVKSNKIIIIIITFKSYIYMIERISSSSIISSLMSVSLSLIIYTKSTESSTDSRLLISPSISFSFLNILSIPFCASG